MKNYLILLLVLFLVVSTSFVGVSNKKVFIDTDTTKMSDNGCLQNSPWPMYGHDAQNTCRSEYDASQNEGYEKWKYYVDYASLNIITPVIDGNGTIYFTSKYDGLYAVYPNGTLKWHSDLTGFTEFQPAIGPDGAIYAGTLSRFHAFYPNGTLQWMLPMEKNFCSRPVVSPEGIVYTGTDDGYLYAVHPNGTIKWEYHLGYSLIATSLDVAGNVYFTARYCDYLYSLSPNGTFRWRFETVHDTSDAPLIGDDGTIFTSPGCYMVAVNPDGTERWRVPTSAIGGSPALSPDGTIVYSSLGREVLGLDPEDGHIRWQYQLDYTPKDKTRPVVSSDGTVFFANVDEGGGTAYLNALNLDGSLKWAARLTTDVYPYDRVLLGPAPSVSADGTVYVTTWFYGEEPSFGYVHAFGQLDPNAPTSPTITGPIKGKVGVQQEYTFTSTSPTGIDLYYYVLWGDGTYVDWIGPFPSGEAVSLNHTWSERGTYTIQARARDSSNLLGPWSTMAVRMPVSHSTPFLQFWTKVIDRFPKAFMILQYLLR